MCSVTKVKCLWFNDPTDLISVITRQAESVELAKSQLEFSVILNVKEFNSPSLFRGSKKNNKKDAQTLCYN